MSCTRTALSVLALLLSVLAITQLLDKTQALPQASPAPPKPAPTPEEIAVRAVLEAQVAAWNKGDIEGFMAGYWNDDKLTFVSGGEVTRGWEPTRQRYIKRYQAEGKDKMGQLAFSELQVETLSPSAALVLGRFDLIRGEKKDWGRFTLAFRKFPDGWRIIHDHTSVPPPLVEKK